MTTMRKRSLWVRTPLLLLTLLQFSLPAAASWADARLGEKNNGPAHIESHSTDGCARIHPADCALHRFLTTPLAGYVATVLSLRDGAGITWIPRATANAHFARHLTLPDSRAPPTLS